MNDEKFYMQGYQAYLDGVPEEANPYQDILHYEAEMAWLDGFDAAMTAALGD